MFCRYCGGLIVGGVCEDCGNPSIKDYIRKYHSSRTVKCKITFVTRDKFKKL